VDMADTMEAADVGTRWVSQMRGCGDTVDTVDVAECRTSSSHPVRRPSIHALPPAQNPSNHAPRIFVPLFSSTSGSLLVRTTHTYSSDLSSPGPPLAFILSSFTCAAKPRQTSAERTHKGSTERPRGQGCRSEADGVDDMMDAADVDTMDTADAVDAELVVDHGCDQGPGDIESNYTSFF
jgi:hypothetical protein